MEKFIGGVVVGWGRLISVAEQEDMYGMEIRVKKCQQMATLVLDFSTIF